jgi:hypothetical protein
MRKPVHQELQAIASWLPLPGLDGGTIDPVVADRRLTGSWLAGWT